MASVLVALIVCGTLLYIARLYFPLLQRTVETNAVAPPPAAPLIPPDLLLNATQWSDPWAREQVLKNIHELYEASGSWDRVRFLLSQQDLE